MHVTAAVFKDPACWLLYWSLHYHLDSLNNCQTARKFSTDRGYTRAKHRPGKSNTHNDLEERSINSLRAMNMNTATRRPTLNKRLPYHG